MSSQMSSYTSNSRMPEGPEARRIADCLRGAILGSTLVALKWDEHSRYARQPLENHGALTTALPKRIVDIRTKGKKIILELEGHVYLVISLGMEGKFLREPDRHSNLWLDLAPETGKDARIYFSDSRHFAIFEIVLSEADLAARLSQLGPDILQEDLSRDQFLAIARNRRLARKEICAFLLDQKRISGIGNYLRAEILYRARIRPNRPLGDLSDEELDRIRVVAMETIRDAYRWNGLTIKSYWDLNGDKGMFPVLVYGKSQDPQGNPVVMTKTKDRYIHWVPAVQV
jgi:DNA-formamidopyrimidine glycosylase